MEGVRILVSMVKGKACLRNKQVEIGDAIIVQDSNSVEVVR